MTAPAVFTIPADQPFADTLAEGVLDQWGETDDPLALARVRILLPTRRAVRATRTAFRRILEQRSGRTALLPAIGTIGDVDEDEVTLISSAPVGLDEAGLPPAVPDLRRTLLLGRLVAAWHRARERRISARQVLTLARDLARLVDSLHTEECDLQGLQDLVPTQFAAHWQQTVDFLKILTDAWPTILQNQGLMDPAQRRVALLDGLTAAWTATPPQDPVIAAGSTGSIPAVSRLLSCIAGLPQGAVILPGLDRDLDADAWTALDESHPQFGLKQLLGALNVSYTDVPDWPKVLSHDDARRARVRLVNEALRPADATQTWKTTADRLRDHPDTVRGMTRIDAPDPALEARAIALIMRESLETPGRTAALVTPDRALARRTCRELRRFGIVVDDSAGDPLAMTRQAVFMGLVARTAAENFAPAPLLSLLKHPLCRFGFEDDAYEQAVCALETGCLRGLRPGPGLAGLITALRADGAAEARALIEAIGKAFRPLTNEMEKGEPLPLDVWAPALVAAAERTAQTSDGEEQLWRGGAGDSLAGLLADLMGDGGYGESISVGDLPGVFDTLIETSVVRTPSGAHPRLFIWGPLEARLQRADIMVLGGLNEGTWPDGNHVDPWLSRPMRRDLGLSLPERRIGMAGHDFAQLCAAPRIVLTRCTKADGVPQVPSRWLLRLEILLKGAGLAGAVKPETDYVALARALDQPSDRIALEEPRPQPPVRVRPKNLSVTEIETLRRDPYAIYAKHVLRLRPLDPVGRLPDARERGIMVHEALQKFISRTINETMTQEEAKAALAEEARRAFSRLNDHPQARVFWHARFEQAISDFLLEEDLWQEMGSPLAVEVKGETTLAGGFTLRARADRIDRHAGGGLAVIDYKTGHPPSEKEIRAGLSPQLPLEGLIAQKGGFEGIEASDVLALRYVRIGGGTPPVSVQAVPKDKDSAAVLIEQAADGLTRLLQRYQDEAMPYLSKPSPKFELDTGDYDHLARIREWRVPLSDGGEGNG